MLNENSIPNYIDSTNINTNVSPNVSSDTDTDSNTNLNNEHNVVIEPELVDDSKLCLICMDENRVDNLVLNKIYITSSECNCEYYIHPKCFREWLAVKYRPKTTLIKCLICRSNVRIKENCCDYCCNCCNYCCKYLYYYVNPRCMFYLVTSFLVLLILISSDGNVF